LAGEKLGKSAGKKQGFLLLVCSVIVFSRWQKACKIFANKLWASVRKGEGGVVDAGTTVNDLFTDHFLGIL
jgi:hypothetical protein